MGAYKELINEGKRKYREEYLKYYETYGDNIPLAYLQKLKELRISLNLQTTDVDDVIAKIKNPALSVRRIITDEDTVPVIDIEALKQDAKELGLSDIYLGLIDEMGKFETYVMNVMNMTAQLSERCKNICKNFADLGNTLAKVGYSRMNKQKSGGKAAVGVGVAIAIAGELYSNYKEKQIKKEEDRRLQVLLEKKQEYALENYDSQKKHLEMYSSKTEKCEKNYLKEFAKEIKWSDPLRNKRLKEFEIAFLAFINFEFLREILQFSLYEMDAWINGEQESNAVYPSLKNIIDEEVLSWATMLLANEGQEFSEEKWDTYLENIINSSQEVYSPAILMLFSNPYFLRNYIGISVWETSDVGLLRNKKNPLLLNIAYEAKEKIGIKTNYEYLAPCKNIDELLNGNKYYQECKEYVSSHDDLNFSIGFSDVLVLILIFFAAFIGALIFIEICSGLIEGGGNWGFVISLILLGLIIRLFIKKRDNILNIMPCIKKSNSQIFALKRSIEKEEINIAKKYNNLKS